MKRSRSSIFFSSLTIILVSAAAALMQGCHVDNFLNPSQTGYYEAEPTTMPILSRLDVIEPDGELWSDTTAVTPEDLLPSELSYRLSSGDVVSVEIFELFQPRTWAAFTRRIDTSGHFRLPELGDVRAGGLTAQELQDRVVERLKQEVMPRPQVNVVIEEDSGFRYTIMGALQGEGVFNLRNSDLRLLAALAIAGGVPPSVKKVYIVRTVSLTDEYMPFYDATSTPAQTQPSDSKIDWENILNNMDPNPDSVQPGVFGGQDGDPPLDITDLQPVRVHSQPIVDIDDMTPDTAVVDSNAGEWIFLPQRNEWVRTSGGPEQANGHENPMEYKASSNNVELVVERIIEIPYDKLKLGDSSYNVVIRPGDKVYVDGPLLGVVYIDGQITRPGVYNMPLAGRLTLSRLVAAAGGLNGIAIPERVDLTRIVGENREAKITLNLAAIRNGTEPDILLKPDDYISIGTNFWATPLAILRGGLRATYGFGFLLDRNFGNDVFGAPPTNFN